MSMTTPYCEKHEWPGGMDRPCPDCDELAKLRAEVERLKDKYSTCEQCDGSTDAGVFCVPCWNTLAEKAGAKNDLREALAKSELQNGEWKLLAGALLQRVHDLGLHQKSIQFCEEPTCKAAFARLSCTDKPTCSCSTTPHYAYCEKSEAGVRTSLDQLGGSDAGV
jgi:hypothetical protein